MHFTADVIGVIHNHSNVELQATARPTEYGHFTTVPSSTLVKYYPTTFVVHSNVSICSEACSDFAAKS